MQKGFTPILILVGILVIVAVAGGAYFFGKSQVSKSQLPNPVVTSQTPQPIITSQSSSTVVPSNNLKTFNDSTYKYSFKYPDTWLVNQSDQGDYQFQVWDRSIDIFSSPYTSTSKYPDVMGQLYIWKPVVAGKKIDIQSFLEKPPVGGFKEAKIGGYIAYRADEVKNDTINISVVFEKDTRVFQIAFAISEGQQQEANKAISEKILQSFRFE